MEEVFAQCEAQLEGAEPQAGVVFACVEAEHQEMLDAIFARYPGIELIGCTTDGELTSQHEFQEDSVALILFATSDKITIRAGVGREVSKGVEAAAAEAISAATREGDGAPKLCITLPESLLASGVSIVEALNRKLEEETLLVGGTAGDQWEFAQTWQFFGQEVLSDSVPVLLFSGELVLSTGIASGWKTIGRRGQVTRASSNVVYEIDEEPALQFYKSYLGENAEASMDFPLGVFDAADQFYVRAPLEYDANDGCITFAGDIPEGCEVQIASATRKEILHACEASVETAWSRFEGERPAAAFVVSCAARKQLLGTRTAEEYRILTDKVEGELPVIGFYSYGEIAPLGEKTQSCFHNETFVTLLLGAA